MQKGSTMIKFQIWGGMIRDNFLKALKMVLRDKQEFYYWKKKVGVGGEKEGECSQQRYPAVKMTLAGLY